MLCKEELGNEVCKGCVICEWEAKKIPNESARTGLLCIIWNDTKSDNSNKFSANTLFYVHNWILFTFPFFSPTLYAHWHTLHAWLGRLSAPTDLGVCIILTLRNALLTTKCRQTVHSQPMLWADEIHYHRNVAFGIFIFFPPKTGSRSLFKVAE